MAKPLDIGFGPGRRLFAAGTVCPEPSLTRQSELGDADINSILRKFEVSGVVPVDMREPMFVDISAVPDFQTVQNQIILAQDAFMTLPAPVRKEFDNSATVFLDRLHDPAWKERLQALGIFEKDPTPGDAARAAVEAAKAAGEPAKPA